MYLVGFVRLFLPAAVVAGSVVACAADVGADPADADGTAAETDSEDLRVGSGYRYKCSRVGGPANTEQVSIALTSRASSATFVHTYADGRTRVGHYGFDPSYAPRTNSSYSRFNYQDGQGNPSSILTYTPMRKGATSGSIKLQDSGDAFSSAYYRCTRTTSVINTGEPAPHAASAAVAAVLSENYYSDPPSGQTPAEMERSLYSIFISPNGTYYAINTNAAMEMGVWSTEGTTLPLSIAFQSGRYKWSGTMTAGQLVWTRGAQTGTLGAPP